MCLETRGRFTRVSCAAKRNWMSASKRCIVETFPAPENAQPMACNRGCTPIIGPVSVPYYHNCRSATSNHSLANGRWHQRLELCRWQIADRRVQSFRVAYFVDEPSDVLLRIGKRLILLERHLLRLECLEERFGTRVLVRVSPRRHADRDAVIAQALDVCARGVFGGFNGSSQRGVDASVVDRPESRLGSSIRASPGGGR